MRRPGPAREFQDCRRGVDSHWWPDGEITGRGQDRWENSGSPPEPKKVCVRPAVRRGKKRRFAVRIDREPLGPGLRILERCGEAQARFPTIRIEGRHNKASALSLDAIQHRPAPEPT